MPCCCNTQRFRPAIPAVVPPIPVDFTFSYICSGNPSFPWNTQFVDTTVPIPSSWSWDFGDGGTSTDQNPVHQYAAAGDYVVTLTVNGGPSSNSHTVHFLNDPGNVLLNFDASATYPPTPIGSTYSGVGVTFNYGLGLDYNQVGHQTTAIDDFISGNNTIDFTTSFDFIAIEFDLCPCGTTVVELWDGPTKVFESTPLIGLCDLWTHFSWSICNQTAALNLKANRVVMKKGDPFDGIYLDNLKLISATL